MHIKIGTDTWCFCRGGQKVNPVIPFSKREHTFKAVENKIKSINRPKTQFVEN